MSRREPHELEDRHREALAVLVQWLDAQCPSLDIHAGTMRTALQGLELMAAQITTLQAHIEGIEVERDVARAGWKDAIEWGGRMEAQRDDARTELRKLFEMSLHAKGEAVDYQEKIYALQREIAELSWTPEPEEEFLWDAKPSPRMQSDLVILDHPWDKPMSEYDIDLHKNPNNRYVWKDKN